MRYYSSGYRSGSIYTLKKVSGVRISKASGSQVKVRWTAVSGASGYQIARSAHSSSGFRTVKSVSSRYTSSKISVSGKRTYHYKVRAYRTEAGKKIYRTVVTDQRIQTQINAVTAADPAVCDVQRRDSPLYFFALWMYI